MKIPILKIVRIFNKEIVFLLQNLKRFQFYRVQFYTRWFFTCHFCRRKESKFLQIGNERTARKFASMFKIIRNRADEF